MLVIADGSEGCYDLGGEGDDERERKRGDATTVTGPGATPVGGTLGHSLAAPAVQTGIWIRACHFGFLLISEKCGNVSFYYDIPPQIIRNEHKTKIIRRKLPFNEVFFVHAVLILFSDCLWMITLSLISDH